MVEDPALSAPVVARPAQVGYAERLFVPWWLWLAGLGLTALVCAEVLLGAPGWWIPYLVLLPAAALGLALLSRLRVAVRDGEFWVDDAHLPVRFIARAGVLDAAGKRDALGPKADPLAFVVQRPWIPGAVLVTLNDPADPTPYWVVSSRHPRQLAEALLAARDAAGGTGAPAGPAPTSTAGTGPRPTDPAPGTPD